MKYPGNCPDCGTSIKSADDEKCPDCSFAFSPPKIEKKACGRWHNDGKNVFASSCPDCLKASNLPSYEDLLERFTTTPIPDQEADRSGMWELNYTDDEAPVCVAGGAAWLYGRSPRPVDKPLAIIDSDEILVPTGIEVTLHPDAGAMRIRLQDGSRRQEAFEEAEAMELAKTDAEDDKKFKAGDIVFCECGRPQGIAEATFKSTICYYCGEKIENKKA